MILNFGQEVKTFDEGMAKSVKEFMVRNAAAKTVIVNCEAGISRSAGVAAALSKVLTRDDEEFFRRYVPNRLVYRKIIEEMQELRV